MKTKYKLLIYYLLFLLLLMIGMGVVSYIYRPRIGKQVASMRMDDGNLFVRVRKFDETPRIIGVSASYFLFESRVLNQKKWDKICLYHCKVIVLIESLIVLFFNAEYISRAPKATSNSLLNEKVF